MEISRGRAPPRFIRMRRRARPMVALARNPGPKTPKPAFSPIRDRMGPLMAKRGAAKGVGAWGPGGVERGGQLPPPRSPRRRDDGQAVGHALVEPELEFVLRHGAPIVPRPPRKCQGLLDTPRRRMLYEERPCGHPSFLKEIAS